jgi:hypothetical protein
MDPGFVNERHRTEREERVSTVPKLTDSDINDRDDERCDGHLLLLDKEQACSVCVYEREKESK